MTKHFLKDALGWGFIMWLIGYILGFIFFALVPKNLIGWAIMPFGIAIALLILFKKIKGNSLQYYLGISAVWTVLAIVCDFLFVVLALNTGSSYYSLDVIIYYGLTFVLPLLVGWRKLATQK